MKYLLLFLILCFSPTIGWGHDACTKPSAYTIDKRCYVTDKEKQQSPYNAVVGLVENEVYCTGTLVCDPEDWRVPYLFTAKHCVLNKDGKTSSDRVWFRTQDGVEHNAIHVKSGDYFNVNDMEDNYDGDWAVYKVADYKENVTVTLVDNDDEACTGTFMNMQGEMFYINAGCVLETDKKTLKKEIVIRNQFGEKETAFLVDNLSYSDSTGVYVTRSYLEDMLVYKRLQPSFKVVEEDINKENYKEYLDKVGLPITDTYWRRDYNTFFVCNTAMPRQNSNRAVSVGYGALKIMSDAAIAEFRKKYIDFLMKNIKGDDGKKFIKKYTENGTHSNDDYERAVLYGFYGDGISAHYDNVYWEDFWNYAGYEYMNNTFYDVELKKSIGAKQGWGGDSGGPYFDQYDQQICIVTRGYSIVGGEWHALSTDCVDINTVWQDLESKTKDKK